ncbi:MAG: tetratricopeptide repeat protein [Acetobacter sp.]|jgi:Tfp pilus assembly protein PilF|nr:tetratricopeptide repeat protein [Acetobacter sp.]MCH4061103.1 tetratricopeptide repeat protein [Acetobacter sp.]MCH4088042.1 tetratricopeptide repeat protein [Acetobacter sp.]MCI1293344.1 tetratricopeptide repeat protein [Acetobacter sp.]MCI1320031.1 tetratricopeptide repeat protein [Acetobacter sp.]
MTSSTQNRITHALRLLADDDAYAAEVLLKEVIASDPDNAEAWHGLACVARSAGRNDLAISLAGRAVQISPEPHFHITLGSALLTEGHLEAARAALNVSVLQNPENPLAHLTLAEVLETLGRINDAETALRNVIRLRPLDAAYRLILSNFLQRHNKLESAITAAQDALSLSQPDDVDARQMLATLLNLVGRTKEAEPLFSEIRTLCPDDPTALANHGMALFHCGQPEKALDLLEQAQQLGSSTPETLNNLALCLMSLGRLNDAEMTFEKILHPKSGIKINHGTVLAELGKFSHAEALYQSVMKDNPDKTESALASFNLATTFLAQARYGEAWPLFETRQVLMPILPFSVPQWDGTARTDAVLLHGEQGLGDFLQFMRWVPIAAEKAPIILSPPSTLLRFLQKMISPLWPKNIRIIPMEELQHEVGNYSAHASLLSLPALLNSPIPVPFCLGHSKHRSETILKVGIAWAGNRNFQFDKRRSLPEGSLAPLLSLPNIEFQSLMPGQTLPGMKPLPEGDMLSTAEEIMKLDLVISVDTAIAHLTGIIGTPLLLLNRFGGDWRWSEFCQSHWYQNVTVLRQTESNTPETAWDAPIRAAMAYLQNFSEG